MNEGPSNAGAARRPGSRRTLFGLVLVAIAWALNWSLDGDRTHVLFFPLWLGAILAADGWTELRTGTSLASRSPAGFALTFLVSAPAWWVFELVNLRLRNWEYVGRQHFSDLEYALFASVSFSTVMPAILCAAELVRSAPFVQRFARGPRVVPSAALDRSLVALGVVTGLAMLAFPRAFYPFVWVSGVLILEPLCRRSGRPGILTDLSRGDWRPWASLWLGGLACGFLWEMWNWRSFPKWIYHTPGAEFLYVFEMPLLGYLGYLPFAMEIWLLKQLVLPRVPGPRL